MSNTNIRYGVSALDMKYRDDAQPDELLVRSKNGQMFYKRDDGQIVTTGNDYTKETLYRDLFNGKPLGKYLDSDYIVYNLIDIAGMTKMSLSSAQSIALGVGFPISKNEDGFYVRIRGNDITNAAISFIRNAYLSRNSSEEYDVELTVAITTGATTKTSTIQCNFNELTLIENEVAENSILEIKSIKYPLISTAISSLTNSQLESVKELNYGNEDFEAAFIDLVTFSSDLYQTTLHNTEDNVRLGFVLPITDYTEFTTKNNGVPIVVSKEKPSFRCLWIQELEEPKLYLESNESDKTIADPVGSDIGSSEERTVSLKNSVSRNLLYPTEGQSSLDDGLANVLLGNKDS